MWGCYRVECETLEVRLGCAELEAFTSGNSGAEVDGKERLATAFQSCYVPSDVWRACKCPYGSTLLLLKGSVMAVRKRL